MRKTKEPGGLHVPHPLRPEGVEEKARARAKLRRKIFLDHAPRGLWCVDLDDLPQGDPSWREAERLVGELARARGE
jgi:hypothetical protein